MSELKRITKRHHEVIQTALDVYDMRVFDGIGYGEIAETLNISLRKVHHMMNLYERVMVSVYGLEMDSE